MSLQFIAQGDVKVGEALTALVGALHTGTGDGMVTVVGRAVADLLASCVASWHGRGDAPTTSVALVDP